MPLEPSGTGVDADIGSRRDETAHYEALVVWVVLVCRLQRRNFFISRCVRSIAARAREKVTRTSWRMLGQVFVDTCPSGSELMLGIWLATPQRRRDYST